MNKRFVFFAVVVNCLFSLHAENIEFADRKNVGLLLEPLNRYESLLLNSTAETAHYIRKELGAPSVLGILWDLFHANIEDPVFPTDDFPLIHHISSQTGHSCFS